MGPVGVGLALVIIFYQRILAGLVLVLRSSFRRRRLSARRKPVVHTVAQAAG
jgi:hypothetical protein